MISSRRLAREWALKILYQMDVGKVSLQEARDTAMERLRMEFVQRGSRIASGSSAELVCLNFVTNALTPSLTTVRAPFERAVLLSTARALSALPYAQEAFFEKSFKNRFKGLRLQPSHLLLPISEEPVYGKDGATASQLSELEQSQIRHYMHEIVDQMPRLFEKELRKAGRALVAVIQQDRFDGDYSDETLLERRRAVNDASEDRWLKVAQMVQKQMADWMHVAAFTLKLINCMEQHRNEVDSVLEGLSSGWKLDRQVAVDRNIMRLAAMEILFLPEIPASASINEAVELAKKFSTAESGRFVNGVLGGIEAQFGGKQSSVQTLDPDDEFIDDIPELSDEALEEDLAIAEADSEEDPENEFEEIENP